MTGQFVGSPAYAPPEALVRGQSDAEGDVYGLGATLYQAAAGSWPRLDDTSGALLAPVPPLAPARADAVRRARRRRSIARSRSSPRRARPRASSPTCSPARPAHRTRSPPTTAAAAALPAASLPTSGVAFPAAAESSPGGATAVGLDTSLPGVRLAGLPAPPPPQLRWQPWVGGAVVVLDDRRDRRDPRLDHGEHAGGARRVRDPTEPPAWAGGRRAAARRSARGSAADDRSARQTKDWNKIVDHLDRGQCGEALDKLDEWEDRYGETPETEALERHLDALKDQEPPRGKGKGKGKGKGRRGRGD